MKKKSIAPVAVLLLCMVYLMIPAQTLAQSQRNYAVGLKAGTAGIGLQGSASVNEYLNVRVSGSYMGYGIDGTTSDMDPNIVYDITTRVLSAGLLADYFPFKRVLSLSAGLYYMDFLVDADVMSAESYQLDDRTFSPERIGNLSAKVDYRSKVAPYVGMGLGNPVSPGSPLTFSFELGAMYTNSPRVKMQGEGMISPTAAYDSRFEEGLSDFKFFPVLNLGLSYRL